MRKDHNDDQGVVASSRSFLGRARRRSLIAASCLVVFAASLAALPAVGHPTDSVRAGRRLGPIRFGETTLSRAIAWFGAPTQRRRVRLGCIHAIQARWGEKLVVFFTTGRQAENRRAIEGEVARRSLRSRAHGTLGMHTVKGLRVGDSSRRLRRLYPRARPIRHRDHFDHFLVSHPRSGRLVAITKTRRGRVTALFAGPYETC